MLSGTSSNGIQGSLKQAAVSHTHTHILHFLQQELHDSWPVLVTIFGYFLGQLLIMTSNDL